MTERDSDSDTYLDDQLKLASMAVKAGDKAWKRAAGHLAEAKKAGATHKQMAKAVGKSEAWVSRLLTWRTQGFSSDTPFDEESKRKRQRAKERVQATEPSAGEVWEDDEPDDEEDAQVERDAADSVRAASNRDVAPGRRRRSEPLKPRFSDDQRNRLIASLKALVNMSVKARAQAASRVNGIREEIDLQWDELLLPSFSDLEEAA